MALPGLALRDAIPGPPPPPPPPGLNYIAPIRIAVRDLLIAHSFSILLVALLIALLYFSTASSRRHTIFWLNVFTILLALSVGGLIDYQTIHTMIDPLHPTPLSINIAIGVLGAVQSIIVDTVLLIRLVSVYPPSFIGKTRFAFLITVPLLLKVARIINLCLFIKALVDATKDPKIANILIGQIWEHKPYLKIEWFAQLFDNSYASGFFLCRLYLHNRESTRVMSKKTAESTFADRVRTLIYVAATNFVVPVLFSLAQIIVVYRDVDLLVVNDIVLVNTSIAVIGVVFATVWVDTGHWARDRSVTAFEGGEKSTHLVFDTNPNQVSSGFSVESAGHAQEAEYGFSSTATDTSKV